MNAPHPRPSASPRATVVVPCYNARGTVRALLDALAAQQTEHPFEVVLVDDGSSDHTADIITRWGQDHPALELRLLRQDNAGPATARNRGAEAARGEWLLFTDADCAPRPDWVQTLLACVAGEEQLGAAGGSYDIANPESALARVIHAEIRWRHRRLGRSIRFAGSYNLALRREFFLQLGGFSEQFPNASAEDNDLSYRVLRARRRIAFCPAARVAHQHTERLGKYLREQYRHGFWRAALYRRHPGMVGGDDYTIWKDALEAPLAAGALALALAAAVAAPPRLLALGAVLALASLQLWAAGQLRLARGDARYFILVGTLRSFARTFGLIAGAAKTRGGAR